MSQNSLSAMLLAAGLGSRLRPLTDFWPKCLMPIGKRPLLEYWLQILQNLGINNVLVNTHFHAGEVHKFIDRTHFSGWVHSVYEPELLGTAGTLRVNSDFFCDQTILLIHADNWCQCDFGAYVEYHFHQRPKHCLMTMMTFDSERPQECGVIETNDQNVVVAFHEKVSNPPGNRANAAVYLLEPEVLKWLNDNPRISDFSTEVLPQFIGRIATWHNPQIHRDIGTLPMLRAAQTDKRPLLHNGADDEWQTAFEVSPVFDNLISALSTLEESNE